MHISYYLHRKAQVLRPLGLATALLIFPPYMKLAIELTDPTIMIPRSMVSPPYGSIAWASEILAVLVVEEVVLVLLPVEVAELEVAAAVAGREESFASVYNHDIMVSVFCGDRTYSFE